MQVILFATSNDSILVKAIIISCLACYTNGLVSLILTFPPCPHSQHNIQKNSLNKSLRQIILILCSKFCRLYCQLRAKVKVCLGADSALVIQSPLPHCPLLFPLTLLLEPCWPPAIPPNTKLPPKGLCYILFPLPEIE